ncbi:MAG: DNA-formamidopyrimidine glycosylase [Nitrospirae bacterium RIFCSPLOWO2_02_FULL_62_14]|nr:MAG: DNA-formamidopyrimidine glycosylase [Nitrospirae bacterium RIFCSPLOWO2_02_FULL_62_14]OGW68487.1 MAG: DNA-formamidopyrimidine glycosylase [Nitrospirae bacterium RIFCSPLOWO2_01_FULL_62_17]
MPELPEAEVVTRQLRQRILGATMKECWVGREDIVRQGIHTLPWYRSARIARVERYGKCVALACERDGETRYLVAELGMTGLLLFGPLAPRYQKHTHCILTLDGGQASDLRYWNPRRFGRLYLLDRPGLEQFVSRRFGCDPLTVSWNEFRNLVHGRRGRIKPLLMHQQMIAGIGNIYANEILFRARLHPARQACRVNEQALGRLYRVMRQVLAQAIKDGGSSVRDFFAPDGSEGRYQRRHLVYGKAGKRCPFGCGGTIKRIRGADQRSSFYCPVCQRK